MKSSQKSIKLVYIGKKDTKEAQWPHANLSDTGKMIKFKPQAEVNIFKQCWSRHSLSHSGSQLLSILVILNVG